MRIDNPRMIIEILNHSSVYNNESLSKHQRNWLWYNADELNITVCIKDCVVTDFTQVKETELFFIQDSDELKKKEEIDTKRTALMLIPETDQDGFVVSWYIPKKKEKKKKVKIIFGIRTTDDEYRSSIKTYCKTYEIAIRESKKHYDWYASSPVGEKGIVPIRLIVG